MDRVKGYFNKEPYTTAFFSLKIETFELHQPGSLPISVIFDNQWTEYLRPWYYRVEVTLPKCFSFIGSSSINRFPKEIRTWPKQKHSFVNTTIQR